MKRQANRGIAEIVAVLAALLLAGCTTYDGGEPRLTRWQGEPVERLIGQLGEPTRIGDLPDGRQVVEYYWQASYRVGGFGPVFWPSIGYHYGSSSGSHLGLSFTFGHVGGWFHRGIWETRSCRARFYASENGIIEKITTAGSDCYQYG